MFCILTFFSPPFPAGIQEREVCVRAEKERLLEASIFYILKRIMFLDEIKADIPGWEWRAFEGIKRRGVRVCGSLQQRDEYFSMSGPKGDCGRRREVGHLVLPKIPLTRGLDRGCRDKGAADTVNEHLIPSQCGQTSDDNGEFLRI